jgi:predicted Zn finger-like uncharacterized protein
VQANCPKCTQKIVIDDARVPDRAFSVKCPKCQTSVRFPGKGGAEAAPPAASAAPPPAAAPGPPPAAPPAPEAPRDDADPGPGAEVLRAEMMAQVRREMAVGDPVRAGAGRALVLLTDRAQGDAMAKLLTRKGYQVDTSDNPEEGSRLIEQGVFDLVAASRAAAAGGKESLYQRMSRLGPDARRRVFLVLVGDDFKTGDGTQAWIAMADLVLHPRDLNSADAVLTKTVEERTRLYQVFLDARKRFELSSAV